MNFVLFVQTGVLSSTGQLWDVRSEVRSEVKSLDQAPWTLRQLVAVHQLSSRGQQALQDTSTTQILNKHGLLFKTLSSD